MKTKNIFKKLFLFFCVFGLVVTSTSAKAAEKPKLSTTSIGISLGTSGIYKAKSDTVYREGKHQVTIQNSYKSAKYTVSTSNKAIVKATVSKNKINLTGVKAGSATITCKQILNGKTTTVGTVKVTVHNAKIGWYYGDNNAADGDKKAPLVSVKTTKPSIQNLHHSDGGYFIKWSSTDKNVKYKFAVDKKGLTVSRSKVKGCLVDAPEKALTTTPKKAGTYKVTLTQTYNKKTVKSSAKSTYVNPQVNETAEFYVGESYYVSDFVNKIGNTDQWLEWDNNILDYTYEDEEKKILVLSPTQAGTVEISLWLKDTDAPENKGEFLGTCKVTVKEAKDKS